jgi:hypothetical protein
MFTNQDNKNLSLFQSITLSTYKDTNDVNIWRRLNFVKAAEAY